MRALVVCCALLSPAILTAQSAKMLRVEVLQKSHWGCKATAAKERSEPTEVKMRMPLSLVRSFLMTLEDSNVKIHGRSQKGFKADELLKMIDQARAGDLLLEVTSNRGDLVKVTLE